MSKWKVLNEYMSYLSFLQGQNLGAENDAVYLNPLPIQDYDERTVTDLVKKHPALLHKLSPLRKASLTFSTRERVETTKKALIESKAVEVDFSHTVASPLRRLKKKLTVSIRNIEEELEVLSLTNLSMEVMENIPSLGWLARLEKTKITEILETYTPKDLATIWIGPEEILNTLQAALAPKKLELLQFYLAKSKPSRENPLFQVIHKRAIEELTKIEANPNEKKAA